MNHPTYHMLAPLSYPHFPVVGGPPPYITATEKQASPRILRDKRTMYSHIGQYDHTLPRKQLDHVTRKLYSKDFTTKISLWLQVKNIYIFFLLLLCNLERNRQKKHIIKVYINAILNKVPCNHAPHRTEQYCIFKERKKSRRKYGFAVTMAKNHNCGSGLQTIFFFQVKSNLIIPLERVLKIMQFSYINIISKVYASRYKAFEEFKMVAQAVGKTSISEFA